MLRCDQPGCRSLVNAAADSGNTPLHAAVNRGDVTVVRQLLTCPNIHVDAVNHECGDVTPLLLAAMHGLLRDLIPLCLHNAFFWLNAPVSVRYNVIVDIIE